MAVLIKGLTKPRSCGDCWFWEHCDRWRKRNWGGLPPDDCPIEAAPADVVEVRHGRWINAYPDIEPNPMFMYGICSQCGFEQSISDKLNYCPNCGATMDGGREDV